jgi:hypothetical protein
MSAVEEYHAFVGAADGYATRDLADAAIAELEAEYDKATTAYLNEVKRAEQAEANSEELHQRLLDELAKNALTPTGRDRLEQAEAELEALRCEVKMFRDDAHAADEELAALRGRRCQDCRMEEGCKVYMALTAHFYEPWSCCHWTARAEEGSVDGEHLTGCLCPTCRRKTGGRS